MRSVDSGGDEASRFLQSEVIGIILARMYVTVRVRNVWHSQQGRQVRDNTAVHLSWAAASAVAHGWRQRGSRFLIWEVPGVAVLSKLGVAAATDFWSGDSFADWDVVPGARHLVCGSAVGATLASLSSEGDWTIRPDQWSTLQGWSPTGTIDRIGERALFRSHESFIDEWGDMVWRESDDMAYSTRGLNRVRRAYVASNGPGALAEGFKRYRELESTRQPEGTRSLLGFVAKPV